LDLPGLLHHRHLLDLLHHRHLLHPLHLLHHRHLPDLPDLLDPGLQTRPLQTCAW
jgi:hypothetical protein